MKRFIILQITGVCCIMATAQSLTGGMYSKEWENERDIIAKTVSSTTHLQPSSQYWWMNGGPRDYFGFDRSRSTQTMTQSSSTRRNSSRKMTGTTNNTVYKGGYHFLENLKRIHEQKEREEREKKRQNAEDRRNGILANNAKMSGFRAQKRARDYYASTTVAENLDKSLTAENYYNLPQENEYSPNKALSHMTQFEDLLYLGHCESLYAVENIGPKLYSMFKEEQQKNRIVSKLGELGIEYTPTVTAEESFADTDIDANTDQANIENSPEESENDENAENHGLNYSTFEEYLAEYKMNGLKNFNDDDEIKFENMLDAYLAIQSNKQ